MSNIFFVLLIVTVGFVRGQEDAVDDVLSVLQVNGKKYLSVTAGNQPSSLMFLDDLKSRVNNYKLQMELDKERLEFWKDTLLVITSVNETDSWSRMLQVLSTTRVMGGFLVILDGTDEQTVLEMLQKDLDVQPEGSYFYLAIDVDGKLVWKRVMTVKNLFHPIITPLRFDQQRYIIEEYDMQGLEIKSVSLDWRPYFALTNCDKQQQNCEISGYLADLMSILAERFNFTIRTDREPDLNWGVKPISGPLNASGTWGGILGRVFSQEEYQFSIGTWITHKSRKDMFDFIHMFNDPILLVLSPRPPEYDIELFIRPFRRENWIIIGCVAAFILGLVNIPSLVIDSYAQTTSRKLYIMFGWLMFVLIEVYYSGALTMFFTSETPLPFDDIIGVFRAYPEWKLMYRVNNDIIYLPYVESGHPDYVRFWEIKEQSPEVHQYPDVPAAMERVLSERMVGDIQKQWVREYLKAHPEVANRIRTLEVGQPIINSLICSKNSPLTPMLRHGMQMLTEDGVAEYLDLKWMGNKDIEGRSQIANSLTLLTPGHVVLVFFIMVGTIMSVLVTLFLEKAWIYFFGKRIKLDIAIFESRPVF